jgi:hypothetical protein
MWQCSGSRYNLWLRTVIQAPYHHKYYQQTPVFTTFIFSVSYKLNILAPSGLSYALGLRTVAWDNAVHSGTPFVLNKTSRAFPQSGRGKYRDTFPTEATSSFVQSLLGAFENLQKKHKAVSFVMYVCPSVHVEKIRLLLIGLS